MSNKTTPADVLSAIKAHTEKLKRQQATCDKLLYGFTIYDIEKFLHNSETAKRQKAKNLIVEFYPQSVNNLYIWMKKQNVTFIEEDWFVYKTIITEEFDDRIILEPHTVFHNVTHSSIQRIYRAYDEIQK